VLNLPPDQWLQRLITSHSKYLPMLKDLNDYYENDPPFSYMHPELIRELDGRLQQLLLNWSALVVDTVEERADLTSFNLETGGAVDDLWDIWEANELEENSSQAHVDSLVFGRSFAIVGAGDEPDDAPLITVESPIEVHAEWDPRTREVVAAYKTWCETLGDGTEVEHATLYLPNATSWWVKQKRTWEIDGEYPPDEHDLGMVPVIPIVNRPRVSRSRKGVGGPTGASELNSVIPVVNAVNKVATDMMVSAEFHSMPRRWALGFGPEDFQDENGNAVSTWSKIAGRIWASEKTSQDGAAVGQFPEAQLSNFHETIKLLGTMTAALYGLPATYMGLAFDNPPSADGIRSLEARLIKRVERKTRAWGRSWERVMRLADQINTGQQRDELQRLEAKWADPATPTVAQKADAAVKLRTSGITSQRQTWEDLGYTAEQQAQMKADLADEADQNATLFKLPTAAQQQGQPPVPGQPPAPGGVDAPAA
jgi:hypothetical protein